MAQFERAHNHRAKSPLVLYNPRELKSRHAGYGDSIQFPYQPNALQLVGQEFEEKGKIF